MQTRSSGICASGASTGTSGASARRRRSSEFAGFLFHDVEPPQVDADDARLLEQARTALADVSPWEAPALEESLKGLCERLGEKPRRVFAPIRLAVTGSKISPGLYESLELLGRDEALDRIQAALGSPA
jgi:glutamyl/glutaminyl-tRNA synthetase